ncbi:unnamed protein product [Arabidopsis lyrata]|nr:unnamed protein product [Arabidopsis lyrata]
MKGTRSVEPGRRPSTNPHRSHLLELIFLKRNTRDRSAVITGDRSKPSLIGNINRKTIQATGFRFHLVTWIKVLCVFGCSKDLYTLIDLQWDLQ